MLLEIGPLARRDLHFITRFITRQSRDPIMGRRFAQRLIERCGDLLSAPGMGSPYAARPGVRKLSEGAYKIFYRVVDERVIILRIWDGRRGQDPAI